MFALLLSLALTADAGTPMTCEETLIEAAQGVFQAERAYMAEKDRFHESLKAIYYELPPGVTARVKITNESMDGHFTATLTMNGGEITVTDLVTQWPPVLTRRCTK